MTFLPRSGMNQEKKIESFKEVGVGGIADIIGNTSNRLTHSHSEFSGNYRLLLSYLRQ